METRILRSPPLTAKSGVKSAVNGGSSVALRFCDWRLVRPAETLYDEAVKLVHERPPRVESTIAPRDASTKDGTSRKLLVERIAASGYLNRSARLREMLLYLTARVLEGRVEQIHEQEVGHHVFGRPVEYDTASDNIVRVHASMLRKRLEQYFAAEGADEPLILEIPKGNYAPVFRERGARDAAPRTSHGDWRIWALATVAAVFACSTAVLWLAKPSHAPLAPASARGSAVRAFWATVFQPGRTTDIVLDDAAIGLYQTLAGRPLALSDYFDRDYLRSLNQTARAARLNPAIASLIVLGRESSYANAGFLWKLFQMPGAANARTTVYFARDYSFRALRSDDAVLLGNSRSNPWVQLFEARVGLRWIYNQQAGQYYPIDTRSGTASFRPAESGGAHPGYCEILLLPNLAGNGNVLIISGTGGGAMNAAAAFLADQRGISELRRHLPVRQNAPFPYFEALLRTTSRSATPRNVAIVLCRPPRG